MGNLGLIDKDREKYIEAIKQLFPRGPYWEKRIEDTEGDLFNIIKTRIEELYRFRQRMADLQRESIIHTASETFDHWEDLYGTEDNRQLDLEVRRELLLAHKTPKVNFEILSSIAKFHGVALHRVYFPYKPGFTGFSRFGIERIAGPAAFSVLYIEATESPETNKELFEQQIRNRLLANQIAFFFYSGGK
ncbi:DUF2313 domain-containing protein [Breznakiella homolactica]|uniref:DUF2313 domain-containing protein n=1 Tax=Breznakiella homolactica TaxID=2798577 RepID=A0A7T7XPX5_9SPIR|nr:DUF2313 domain-containing protein [Breznakiella homolactica]QQO10313.1 DUF2313 domain-containing protein [Breznakiella homolactica]